MDIEKRIKEIERDMEEVKAVLFMDDKKVEIPENFPVWYINNGDAIHGYNKHNFRCDCVGEMHIDWEMVWRLLNAPDWARWLACAVNGKWFFSEREQKIYDNVWTTGFNYNGESNRVDERNFIPFTDWKNSLSKRPEGM
jgi:hypothetical protein